VHASSSRVLTLKNIYFRKPWTYRQDHNLRHPGSVSKQEYMDHTLAELQRCSSPMDCDYSCAPGGLPDSEATMLHMLQEHPDIMTSTSCTRLLCATRVFRVQHDAMWSNNTNATSVQAPPVFHPSNCKQVCKHCSVDSNNLCIVLYHSPQAAMYTVLNRKGTLFGAVSLPADCGWLRNPCQMPQERCHESDQY
jgi:hypothetical protein